MFRYGIPILLIALQILVYFRMAFWMKESFPNHKWVLRIVRVLFIVFSISALYVLIERPQIHGFPVWVQYITAYPFFIWHGATFFLGIVFLVGLLVELPTKGVLAVARFIPATKRKLESIEASESYTRFDASRRAFIRRGMYSLTAASFGGSTYGLLVEKSSFELTETSFNIPNLPPELSGCTIALISDIHSSPYMLKPEMEKYVERVNNVRADLIVVDGDFVNSRLEEVYPFAEAFSELKAPLGVYGVMGNHDFYNQDPELVAKTIDDCGIRLLRNDKTIVDKNGGRFYLIGVDDIGRARNAPVKLEEAMGYAPLGIPRILLCHRPYYLEQAASKHVDLVLSGHTHGGQVVLGQFGDVVIAPASLASRFVQGKYSHGSTHMYVSRGIGTVGLPIRLNCPPEITKITLNPA